MKHYDFEISRFIDNELSANEQKEVFSHLSGCEECRDLLSDFMEMKKGTKSYYNNLQVELKSPAELLTGNIATKKRNVYKPLFYISVAASIILVLFSLSESGKQAGLKESNYNAPIEVTRVKMDTSKRQDDKPAAAQSNVTRKLAIVNAELNRTNRYNKKEYSFRAAQSQYLKSLNSVKTIYLTKADIVSN
jgi:hypothetical protein